MKRSMRAVVVLELLLTSKHLFTMKLCHVPSPLSHTLILRFTNDNTADTCAWRPPKSHLQVSYHASEVHHHLEKDTPRRTRHLDNGLLTMSIGADRVLC